MSPETAVAVLGLGGSLVSGCIYFGIVVGRLLHRVDTAERDLDKAFEMIRLKQKE